MNFRTGSQIDIREAADADLPEILNLHAQLDLQPSQGLFLEEAQKIWDRIKSYPDYRIYVATCDGHIIGTFALLVMDNLAHQGVPSAILEDVVVSPN